MIRIIIYQKENYFISYSFFITYLEEPMFNKFGKPLYHSEFGEGFDDEKLNKYSYASYFIEVNGVEMHIGFDHRGSSIKVDDSKSPLEISNAIIELAKYIL